MKVILEIPIEAYLLCLSRFRSRSSEYLMLRNGITVPDDRGETVVQILCNAEKVELFLNIVSDVCTEFIDKIRQRPDVPSEN